MECWRRLLPQQPPMASWMSWLRFPRPGHRPLSATVRGPYSSRPAPGPDPSGGLLSLPKQGWVWLILLRVGGAHFLESSAHDPIIFENVQQLSRSFSGILITRPKPFPEIVGSGRMLRIVWWEYRGGCRPHIPTRAEPPPPAGSPRGVIRK